jgi:hypothetical protein
MPKSGSVQPSETPDGYADGDAVGGRGPARAARGAVPVEAYLVTSLCGVPRSTLVVFSQLIPSAASGACLSEGDVGAGEYGEGEGGQDGAHEVDAADAGMG